MTPLATVPHPIVELAEAKAALRRRMRALRRERAPALRTAAGTAAVRHLAALLAVAPPGPLAVFAALPLEIDTEPVIASLVRAGRTVLLPRQEGRERPLAFHLFQPGDPLIPGPMGVPEPSPAAPRLRPASLLVPLLAFDREGRRLGYGAGFYDRTLAALRAGERPPLAIGLAFAFQEVERVPAGPADERLDGVLTDREWIDCRAVARKRGDETGADPARG